MCRSHLYNNAELIRKDKVKKHTFHSYPLNLFVMPDTSLTTLPLTVQVLLYLVLDIFTVYMISLDGPIHSWFQLS